MTISNEYREDVYRYIWKIIDVNNCKLLRIGGIPNHIHILLNLHPSVSLSALVRDIKAKSSGWLRKDVRFPRFDGWAKEYFAATVAYKDRLPVIDYIKNQQEHHGLRKYEEELALLLNREGIQPTEYDT